MGKPVIIINSVTNALKAKQVLAAKGIKAEVIKSQNGRKGEGCSYSLVVKGDVSLAEQIIRNSGIYVVGRAEVDL